MVDHRHRTFALYAGIIALAVVASATSLTNGFAFDDVALIARNPRVHSLDGWWRLFAQAYWPPQQGESLYRPVVTLGFALQWWAGGGSPLPFHITSVSLYALASGLTYALMRRVVRTPAAAFAAAALFAVHPVHVEAVGNVVGQSELLAAVATLAASIVYLNARRHGRLRWKPTTAIALLFVAACLSKEHALLLPAILMALELFAVRDANASSLTQRFRQVLPLLSVLALVAVAYLMARTLVLGELLGEKHLVPVVGMRRLWVMLAVAPHWLRLLFFPARLSADYSPHHIELPSGPGLTVLPGIIVLIAVAALYRALGAGSEESAEDRRTGRLAIAIGGLTLLPVSNLFSVMVIAERALFMPSVGAMMAVGAVGSALVSRLRASRRAGLRGPAMVAVTGLLLMAGAWRSGERQHVWRDNAALFRQTVMDAPRSYRAQFFFGQLLFEQGRRTEGERHLRRAIELNPTPSDVSPLNYLATQYRIGGLCAPALPLYERAIAADDTRPDVRYGLAACLLETGRVQDARRVAEDGVRRGDLRSLFQELLAKSDSASLRG